MGTGDNQWLVVLGFLMMVLRIFGYTGVALSKALEHQFER